MNRRPAPRSIFDWKAVVGIVLSAALLYWALRDVDFHKVLSEVRRADPLWFLVSVVTATAVFWLRAWRWGPLLRGALPNARFKSRLAATMIGFMGNNVLPARIGEFARAYALSHTENVSVVAAFASLLTERLFDAIAIVALLFIATALPNFPDIHQLAGRDFSTMANTAAAVVGALILISLLLVLWPQRTVRFFEQRVARWLPQRARRPLIDALEAFLAGMGSLRSPAVVALIVVQTLIVWIVNALGFYFAFLAFHVNASFAGALFLQSVTALFVSLPSAPGFFGFFESAARIVLVELFGVELNKTLGFAIGFHIGGFVPVTVIGLYYAWKLGLSWREVEHSEETVEDAVERELPAPPDPRR